MSERGSRQCHVPVDYEHDRNVGHAQPTPRVPSYAALTNYFQIRSPSLTLPEQLFIYKKHSNIKQSHQQEYNNIVTKQH